MAQAGDVGGGGLSQKRKEKRIKANEVKNVIIIVSGESIPVRPCS